MEYIEDIFERSRPRDVHFSSFREQWQRLGLRMVHLMSHDGISHSTAADERDFEAATEKLLNECYTTLVSKLSRAPPQDRRTRIFSLYALYILYSTQIFPHKHKIRFPQESWPALQRLCADARHWNVLDPLYVWRKMQSENMALFTAAAASPDPADPDGAEGDADADADSAAATATASAAAAGEELAALLSAPPTTATFLSAGGECEWGPEDARGARWGLGLGSLCRARALYLDSRRSLSEPHAHAHSHSSAVGDNRLGDADTGTGRDRDKEENGDGEGSQCEPLSVEYPDIAPRAASLLQELEATVDASRLQRASAAGAGGMGMSSSALNSLGSSETHRILLAQSAQSQSHSTARAHIGSLSAIDRSYRTAQAGQSARTTHPVNSAHTQHTHGGRSGADTGLPLRRPEGGQVGSHAVSCLVPFGQLGQLSQLIQPPRAPASPQSAGVGDQLQGVHDEASFHDIISEELERAERTLPPPHRQHTAPVAASDTGPTPPSPCVSPAAPHSRPSAAASRRPSRSARAAARPTNQPEGSEGTERANAEAEAEAEANAEANANADGRVLGQARSGPGCLPRCGRMGRLVLATWHLD